MLPLQRMNTFLFHTQFLRRILEDVANQDNCHKSETPGL